MRMLVVGATGYVGRDVVSAAMAAGHAVIAHVRPASASGDRASAEFAARGVRVIRTPWTGEAWRHALEVEAPERIFLLLGTFAGRARTARSGGGDASQATVDLGLTILVLHAAQVGAPEAGVVYLSALGASPTGNEYLKVRATVEAALARGSNPFTLVRPSFITGPDRVESRPGERVGAILADAAGSMLRLVGRRGLAARLGSITGGDLAAILVGLAAAPLDRQVHELDDFRR